MINAFSTFSIEASLTCVAVLKVVEDPAVTLFLTESPFFLYYPSCSFIHRINYSTFCYSFSIIWEAQNINSIRIHESISFCSQEKSRADLFLSDLSFDNAAMLLLSASQHGPTRLRQSQQLRRSEHHWRRSFTDNFAQLKRRSSKAIC
ncbi:hypothetical protein CDAR_245001 [Caerostris darwini]|uniref:Uncharacterized protein n=1 Tax=Caerostris darwini TaxID=1538125 RepID=A0AAV4V732_9ARAC|nr:hypothetical protein CDAR_245001 [Caerostris darwini]